MVAEVLGKGEINIMEECECLDDLHDLGFTDENGVYNIKDTCLETLDKFMLELNQDGPFLRFRRSLGHSETVHKDFVPLLITATTKVHKVIPKLIRFLSNLTAPIECLVTTAFTDTEEGTQVVYEVTELLKSFKSEFADFQLSQCVVTFIKGITNKNGLLTHEECEYVSDGLLLLRNILHIPHPDTQLQNQILWNLFSHSIDKILIHLMTCEQKNEWGITLVQLIALIYKDQHVQHLQKLLNLWLENSMSESSEDNESNTSPKEQEEFCDSSSPMLTSSDPTNSDSSDGDKEKVSSSGDILPPPVVYQHTTSHSQQKCYTKAKSKSGKIKAEKQSDADSGILSIGNSIANTNDGKTSEDPNFSKEECTSTSSNEDDQHQEVVLRQMSSTKRDSRNGKQGNNHQHLHPPHNKTTQKHIRVPSMKGSTLPTVSPQDNHELKRKKLHKRSKKGRKNMKSLVHHNPTEEDISLILREFTVDFLLKGYASLVSLLQEQLCSNSTIQMDKSHFLWLITYFLKFASQLELDLEHISPVLSYDIISYLTFEGVAMSENLALCKDDLKPHLRRMHLVVTAIREFVQVVEIYSKMPSYSHDDKVYLNQLRNDMLHVEELRNLFILLIRQFRPGVQSKQYLQDLITTNHVFLLLLEQSQAKAEDKDEFHLKEFIKEFSSPVIIQQYAHLLEDFQRNGEFVNDCVFTMMHHVAGDLCNPEALCQPRILKTFSQIWEVEFEVKDDWADLIEYVIQRFMKVKTDEQKQIFQSNTSNQSEEAGWSQEDIESLYWLYSSCTEASDPASTILDAYREQGCGSGKSRESVLNQLLLQRIIGYNQFLHFLTNDSVDVTGGGHSVCEVSSSTSSSLAAKPQRPLDPIHHEFQDDEGNENPSSTTPSVCGSSAMPPAVDIFSLEISVGGLIGELIANGHGYDMLSWIQKQVLEACHVKIRLEENQNINKREKEARKNEILQPVPHHFALLGYSIPIVPWTKLQEIALISPPYVLLLHKLGFHLAGDVGKVFPRMPHFWTPDILLAVANQLGPLPSIEQLKFDPSKIPEVDLDVVKSRACLYAGPEVKQGEEFSLPGVGVGVGVGNSFLQSHASYGFGSGGHTVNWSNLVHKSMQLSDRHSEAVDDISSTTGSEHMDDCASLKALPPAPSDISEDVNMFSDAAESDTEDDEPIQHRGNYY